MKGIPESIFLVVILIYNINLKLSRGKSIHIIKAIIYSNNDSLIKVIALFKFRNFKY